MESNPATNDAYWVLNDSFSLQNELHKNALFVACLLVVIIAEWLI